MEPSEEDISMFLTFVGIHVERSEVIARLKVKLQGREMLGQLT